MEVRSIEAEPADTRSANEGVDIGGRPPAWVLFLLAGLLACTALAPRVMSSDRAFTTDEFGWIVRSQKFTDALRRGQLKETIQSGHPGVTTMWIGGFAQETLPDDATVQQRLARARVWLAVVDVAVIILIWFLAGPILGLVTATIGALLLALDPFVLAHNRVLHLDGLLALFMTASFLALMRASDKRSMTVVSGFLAGLALLTKVVAVFLIPVALLVFVMRRRPRFLHFAAWCGSMLFAPLLLWPGSWAAPSLAVSAMKTGGTEALVSAHPAGYFLGAQVDDPGPLFYPAVLGWRSSALVLPAVIGTVVWAFRRRRNPQARAALDLLAFAAGLVLMITLAAKKGDRYVLPAFPPLDLAAAIGLVAASRAVAQRPSIQTMVRGRLGKPAVAFTVTAAMALHAGPALALHPYELAHYNLALGGSTTGKHVFIVGWGEGLDAAAAYLNQLPDARHLTVATIAHPLQGGFSKLFIGRTRKAKSVANADYVVFYMPRVQRGLDVTRYERYRDLEPIWDLEVNGLPYVRIYEGL